MSAHIKKRLTACCGVSEVVVVYSACQHFHRTLFLMGAVCCVCGCYGRPGQQRTSQQKHTPRSEAQKTVHFKNSVFQRVVFATRGCCGEANTRWTNYHDDAGEQSLQSCVARASSRFAVSHPAPSLPYPPVVNSMWVVPVRRSASGETPPPGDGARELRQQDLVVAL